MNSADILARSPRIAQRVFDERMLVISVDDSRLHRFNEVGTFIWQSLETPRTIGDISKKVSGHFDGCGQEDALHDVIAFADKLAASGLITITPAGESRLT